MAGGAGGPLSDVVGVEEIAEDVGAEGMDAPPADLGGDAGGEVVEPGRERILRQAGPYGPGPDSAGPGVADAGVELGVAGAGLDGGAGRSSASCPEGGEVWTESPPTSSRPSHSGHLRGALRGGPTQFPQPGRDRRT